MSRRSLTRATVGFTLAGLFVDVTALVEATSGTIHATTHQAKMKSKLALIAALCALAFPMTFAGDENKPSTAVSAGNEAATPEERLIEVDFSVTLEHYRKVRALILEDEFDRLFTEKAKGEEEATLEAQIRRTKLRDYAEKLRLQAIEHGAKLQKLREARQANLGSGKTDAGSLPRYGRKGNQDQ